MTTPERQRAPSSVAEPRSDSLLGMRVIPLPGAVLDPVAVYAAVPPQRAAALWWRPGAGDAAGEAQVGVGTALRLVATEGPDPAAAVVSLRDQLRRARDERPDPAAVAAAVAAGQDTPRAFFALAFDPRHAFGDGEERERWRGFVAAEARVPEILLRLPDPAADRDGSSSDPPGPKALLVGPPDRLDELEDELADLLAEAAKQEERLRALPANAPDNQAHPADPPPAQTAVLTDSPSEEKTHPTDPSSEQKGGAGAPLAPREGGEGAGGSGGRPDGADLSISWGATRHRRAVEAALATLDDPDLSKVVLAHAVEVRRRNPFDPPALLAALRRLHPGCFLFAFRPAGDPAASSTAAPASANEPPGAAPVFLGASPERLVLVRDPRRQPPPLSDEGPLEVLSGALAGTAPRGATPEEDRRLGERLLASGKDREEHRIVEEMIADSLAPLSQSLARGGEPVLQRLENVQHLYTPVTGTLRPGYNLFDAVAALHPTPAVGGMPRDRAMTAIRDLETTPRGLYAGAIGWVDTAGRGDTAVAIRSALVDGDRARLYAGGGIVPTSDPDVEVEEIRIKLAAVLDAMRSPADSDSTG